MRITGSPGSYGPVRFGNPYVRLIRGMPVRNWTSCNVLATCKRVVYGFSTGFLQFHYDVLAKGSQEPVRLPYGYSTVHVRVRTVHVRAPYGPVCAWEHPYNDTIIVRGLCGSRWWPWVLIRVLGPVRLPTCLLREKKDVHAQLSDKGCLRVYGVYTGWKNP